MKKPSFLFSLLGLICLLCSNCKLADLNKAIPIIKEEHPYECGPRCLQMITSYHGKEIEFDSLARLAEMNPIDGTNLLGLSTAAETLGFTTLAVKIPYKAENPKEESSLIDVPLPCIAHWRKNYFIVVDKVSSKEVAVVHPQKGKLVYSRERFCEGWLDNTEGNEGLGIVLLLETNDQF